MQKLNPPAFRSIRTGISRTRKRRPSGWQYVWDLSRTPDTPLGWRGKKGSKWSLESHGTERMKRFSLSVSVASYYRYSNCVEYCLLLLLKQSRHEWRRTALSLFMTSRAKMISNEIRTPLLLCYSFYYCVNTWLTNTSQWGVITVDQYHMLFITVLQTHTQTAMWPVLDCVSWQALTPDLITHVKWTIKSKSETWVPGKRGGLDPRDTLRHTNISSEPFCSAGQALVNSWKNHVSLVKL